VDFIFFWKITGSFTQFPRNFFHRFTRLFPTQYICYDLLLFLSYKLLITDHKKTKAVVLLHKENKRHSHLFDYITFFLGRPIPKRDNGHDENRYYALATKFIARSEPFIGQNWFPFSALTSKLPCYWRSAFLRESILKKRDGILYTEGHFCFYCMHISISSNHGYTVTGGRDLVETRVLNMNNY